MEKISGVYKITNTITNDFYIGSSKDINRRWAAHKRPSSWNKQPNSPMYLDFQKYGVDSFEFQILEEAEPDSLKEKEQKFIETLKPTYNQVNAKGWDIERYKESHIKSKKKYQKSDKGKKSQRKYQNQLCLYNSETITLCALSTRFRRKGIDHPTQEAKKYLIKDKYQVEFDNDKFEQWCIDRAREGYEVFVCEYNIENPAFEEILSKEVINGGGGNKNQKRSIEKLYHVKK